MSYPSAPDPLATRLGYAGLIPFVLLAALLWIVQADLRPWLTIALASYAALIATFLGGIHWGIAAAQSFGQRSFHLIWGVTPSIIAWLALIMPAYAGLPLIAALLVACYLVDLKSYPSAGWAAWLPLRLKLTVIAVLSCLIGAGAI
ncbi:DUF3429 domain-containing protein [Variovorax sp. PCZ-1]|uniref:DUF3429 domain-containing protein n=1 Tax=Variovorax sp. PCZ-1 TaxID=2835533 RepID=UPI001BD0D41F|nr:DUF3429 domain-containing protein [Variovorax sp. PCZ-1]MBS7807048.1 DUF3429 domain-containing protein [Variovorax sp. PCZ-1]